MIVEIITKFPQLVEPAAQHGVAGVVDVGAGRVGGERVGGAGRAAAARLQPLDHAPPARRVHGARPPPAVSRTQRRRLRYDL